MSKYTLKFLDARTKRLFPRIAKKIPQSTNGNDKTVTTKRNMDIKPKITQKEKFPSVNQNRITGYIKKKTLKKSPRIVYPTPSKHNFSSPTIITI